MGQDAERARCARAGHRVHRARTPLAVVRHSTTPMPAYAGRVTSSARFRMGRLDHVHIRVPDRAEAAAWYSDHLGFEPVERFDFWASGFEGGPLQISADGGRTMLALFEAGQGHPMVPQQTGVAFSVDAGVFAEFARSLPCGIDSPAGRPLMPSDVIDFDMCWAYDLVDPWGNQYELNCYEYDQVKTDLIEAEAITPARYWPRDLFLDHSRHHRSSTETR
ncbi:MAG: hypothetical protein QOF40_2994 [Actinomycetota bacterium]|nr:hypothetical protein [Actinomycetota bacterium]